MAAYGTYRYRRERASSFRLSIPMEYRGIFGYCELRRSLDTGNRRRAQAMRLNGFLRTRPWRERMSRTVASLRVSTSGQGVLNQTLDIRRSAEAIGTKEDEWVRLEMSARRTMQVSMFDLMAGSERALVSQRTKSGLDRARAEGKQLGRPKGLGKSRLDSQGRGD